VVKQYDDLENLEDTALDGLRKALVKNGEAMHVTAGYLTMTRLMCERVNWKNGKLRVRDDDYGSRRREILEVPFDLDELLFNALVDDEELAIMAGEQIQQLYTGTEDSQACGPVLDRFLDVLKGATDDNGIARMHKDRTKENNLNELNFSTVDAYGRCPKCK
jgi:hypothetical protein